MHEEQNENFVLKFQIMYDGSRVPIVCIILFLYPGKSFFCELASVWWLIVIVIILEGLKISEVEDIIGLVTLL